MTIEGDEITVNQEQFKRLYQLINGNTVLCERLKASVDNKATREDEKNARAATLAYLQVKQWFGALDGNPSKGNRWSRSQSKSEMGDHTAGLGPSQSGDETKKSGLKIYADGVFDLIHFGMVVAVDFMTGHFNALCQAKSLGDKLFVGVVSDEEVLQAKGVLPIYTCEERARIVSACKWVDGIITEAPYNVDAKFFKSTGCDFAAHGDDVALNSMGEVSLTKLILLQDSYKELRQDNLLKTFKRTPGVSTTSLASRLLGVAASLRMSEPEASPIPLRVYTSNSLEHDSDKIDEESEHDELDINKPAEQSLSSEETPLAKSPDCKRSLVSTKRLLQFMGSPQVPKPGSKIIYIDGSFDLLHCGHINLLEEAKEHGDFLIVGIYDDITSRNLKGPLFPIQTMLERALGIMAMRAVDEVIIGASSKLSKEMLSAFNISKVIRTTPSNFCPSPWEQSLIDEGVLIYVENKEDFSSHTIVNRIIANREKLQESLVKRLKKEDDIANNRIEKYTPS